MKDAKTSDGGEKRASPRVAVVLVAAGRGTRAQTGTETAPKQYRAIGGRPVLAWTSEAFLAHPDVARLVVTIHPDDRALYDAAMADVADAGGRVMEPVAGGTDRQASVFKGLEALATDAPDLVLIHDAVRPFVSRASIDTAIDALSRHSAVVVGVPVVDTVKRVDARGVISDTVPRERLWRAATPQGFRFTDILTAHTRAAASGASGLTDDGAVAEWAGHEVMMVPTDEGNIKLTTPEDFARAEQRLTEARYLALADIRVGTGYDVHVLEPGEAVILGGVAIPHDQKLKGHSDADVALHALTDAILGAIGDGDIGQHFPPSDPQWRGAASKLFLADAVRRVIERGGMVSHCDITLIAEAPKISPHRDAMRAAIAEVIGVSLDRVAVKATTNEGLGFAGRREGIAAIATATVRLPMPGRGA